MQWNRKYDYPKSSRTTVDGIRRYLLGEEKLPSVTSILDVTKSDEDKAALANWRERTGYKEAEAITKAASSRGSFRILSTLIPASIAESFVACL